MYTKLSVLAVSGIVGSLALPACSLDIPDLNNPGLEQLENNPTTAGINTAATGLLVGDRLQRGLGRMIGRLSESPSAERRAQEPHDLPG